jgi:AraC-like DNA-binding protein
VTRFPTRLSGMREVFRALDEPASSRREYWRGLISDTYLPMDVRFDDDLDARDEIVTGQLGAVRVTQASAGAGRVERTARHIRRSDLEMCKLLVHSAGRVIGQQHGRETMLGPGDLTLVDMAHPFRCLHSSMQVVCVMFPLNLTPLGMDDVAQLAGLRIRGDRGTGALISTLIRQLPSYLGHDGGAAGARLGSVVLDLFASAVAESQDRIGTLEPDLRRQTLLTRVHAFIEQRLGDPDLSPTSVAAAHHISLRYLHRLFQEQDTTVAGWIRTRRLERCRADLLAPDEFDRPVAAIAAARGFASASHFSRVFRDRYGMPPAEFRAAYKTPALDSAS